MKKQILILIVAIFAITVSTAYGQAVHNTSPTALSCTSGPLNPIAGVPYDYSATFSPTGGNSYWYATTATTFIAGSARTANQEAAGGTFVTSASANYQTSTPVASNPSTTNITWNAAGLSTVTAAAPLFVVVDYTGSACANNMKVYKIEPLNGFTVDVFNSDATLSTPVLTPTATCVSNIEGASYDGTKIVTNYGKNVLYFEVVAANFTGTWTPAMAVTGLQGDQSATIEYSYLKDFSTLIVGDVSTTETNTSDGVSIYVRVTVSNNTYEGLSSTPISLTVNGVSNGLVDVTNTDCATNSLTDDVAVQTLNARPTVTSVPATGVFVTP